MYSIQHEDKLHIPQTYDPLDPVYVIQVDSRKFALVLQLELIVICGRIVTIYLKTL